MNLIISYFDKYYETHGTLSPYYADRLAEKSNSKVICFYSKDLACPSNSMLRGLKHTEFVELSQRGIFDLYDIVYGVGSPVVQRICDEIVNRHSPKTLFFFNEFYFFQYFTKFSGKKIYFVRCLSKKLLSILQQFNDGSAIWAETIRIEKLRMVSEEKVLLNADCYVADSFSSSRALKAFYGVDSIVVPGIIDKKNFESVEEPNFKRKAAYFLGRMDLQKGIQNIKSPTTYELHVIGHEILSPIPPPIPCGAKRHGHLSFEEYINIISSIPFALFPHLWESNGLTLQEALAMGKVVIVQKNGGGYEEHIVDGENGFFFDFQASGHWETFLDKLAVRFDLKKISAQAKESISSDGYEYSINSLAKIIKSSKC